MWNVSVSDHCCQHCDGVVYKADSVIETVFHQDECETVESSICRILPGAFSFLTRIKGPLKIASSLLLCLHNIFLGLRLGLVNIFQYLAKKLSAIYEACKSVKKFLYIYFHCLDSRFAVIESEFNYKHCCNDGEGMFRFILSSFQ